MANHSSEIKEFKNEKLHIQLIVEPGCQIKVDVEVAPELSSSSYQEAIKKIRKEVSLPGFRKGKAPEALLIKNYGSAIDKQWKECLLQDAFSEAIRLSGYYPLKSAAKSIKTAVKEINEASGPAKLHFEYEAEPKVPSIDLNLIKLAPKEPAPINEEEVEEFLLQSQLAYATWEIEENRPAQTEDFVRLDIEKIHGDHTHMEFSDKRFQITDKKMSRWLRELVIGLSIGGTAEGISAPEEALDSDIDEETKATFKPTPYKVTLKAIEKPTLPELNDEFAQKIGGKDLNDVREKIRLQLQKRAEEKLKEERSEEIEEILVTQYDFDLPKSALEKEQKLIEEVKIRQLRGNQQCSDTDLTNEMSEAKQKANIEGKRHLQLFYLLREYTHKNNIAVTQNEMNMEISNLLRNVPKEHVNEVLKSLDEQVYRSILENLIISKGIEDLLGKLTLQIEST